MQVTGAVDGISSGEQVVDLRYLMAEFPTGVGVVTAMAERGRPFGMTCTSICSVALEPPTLIVCMRSDSPTLAAVHHSRAFALNLLDCHSMAVAELFASGRADRFSQVRWSLPSGAGGPHLVGPAHTIADCRVQHEWEVGDHMVVVGGVACIGPKRPAAPLLHGRRQYAAWPAR